MPQTLIDQSLLADLKDRADRNLSVEPRPFVRWAGSKRLLLKTIVPHLPTSYGRYFEPFLGSGALFFLLRPRVAKLNDQCAELVDVYRAIAQDSAGVAEAALKIPFDKDTFYEIRKNRSENQVKRAGEFLYLNRACFNGLYRVNSAGVFNVPWGAPKSDFVVDKANLAACSELLSPTSVTLTSGDFAEALKNCRAGDLIFLDPPYVTKHNNNGFVDYNETLFSWQDQIRLAGLAEKLRARGCHVLVTNAMHAEVIALYPNFSLHRLDRKSTLAGASDKRSNVTEALFVGARNG